MIDMLRALMKKVDNMQEQMGSVSREFETLISPKEMLGIKNTVTEMNNTFDGSSVDWTDMTEERFSEHKGMSRETF